MSRLRTMPTTNARIALTLLLAALTGALVIVSGIIAGIVALRTSGQVSMETWTPDGWLTFLSVWAGIDVVQFGVKRATYKEPENPETPP